MNIILLLASISISIVKDVYADEHNHVVSYLKVYFVNIFKIFQIMFLSKLSYFSMKIMKR